MNKIEAKIKMNKDNMVYLAGISLALILYIISVLPAFLFKFGDLYNAIYTIYMNVLLLNYILATIILNVTKYAIKRG